MNYKEIKEELKEPFDDILEIIHNYHLSGKIAGHNEAISGILKVKEIKENKKLYEKIKSMIQIGIA